ncbi:MAG TPA: hypothetical protein VGS23_02660, partial [Thermoplasmata archaeon]|nr:hypothetical protein [Thermoplasmata archaeon]
MNRPARRSAGFASVGLVVLLLASGALPPARSPAPLSPSERTPFDASGGASPFLAAQNGTFVVSNASLLPGAFLPGNGRNPFAGTYDPWNGNTYFVDADSGTSPSENVTVVSGPSRAVIATDPIGSGPSSPAGIAADPQEGDVFVANSAFSSVTVLNGSTERVRATVTVGFGPGAIVFDPLLGDMVVANTGSSSVSFLDVSTDRVVGNVSVGA